MSHCTRKEPFLNFSKSIFLTFFSILSLDSFLFSQELRYVDFLYQGIKLSYFNTNYSTAPTSFEEAENLKFPDLIKLDLNFSIYNYKEGNYIAPDQGSVKIYSKNNYEWELAKGGKITVFPNGTRIFTWSGHKIFFYPKSCSDCEPSFLWKFPDGSSILKTRHRIKKTVEFEYSQQTENEIYKYKILKEGDWAPFRKIVGPFVVDYSEKWKVYLNALVESENMEDILIRSEKITGFKNPGFVPVVFFDSPIRHAKFYAGKETSIEGGRGSAFIITMCCEKQATAEKEISKVDLLIFYHELNHNFQQLHCEKARLGGNYPKPISPGIWFMEGQGNFLAMNLDARIKEKQLNYFYNYIINNKNKSITSYKYGDKDIMNAYVSGAMMIEYLNQKFGKNKILQFYEETCRGSSEETVINKLFSENVEGIYLNTKEYFKNIKK